MSAEFNLDHGSLRVTELVRRLVQAIADVGDSPVIVQDDDGAEYKPYEIDCSTGDIGLILRSPEL